MEKLFHNRHNNTQPQLGADELQRKSKGLNSQDLSGFMKAKLTGQETGNMLGTHEVEMFPNV